LNSYRVAHSSAQKLTEQWQTRLAIIVLQIHTSILCLGYSMCKAYHNELSVATSADESIMMTMTMTSRSPCHVTDVGHMLMGLASPLSDAANVRLPASSTQARRRWRHLPIASSIAAWLGAAHSLSLTYSLKMDTTNIKQVTDFQWFCSLNDVLSRCMCYLVWTYCCKWPNYSYFCILQGIMTTVLRWGGQNCSHLRQVSSSCRMPSIKIGQCFSELFKK